MQTGTGIQNPVEKSQSDEKLLSKIFQANLFCLDILIRVFNFGITIALPVLPDGTETV